MRQRHVAFVACAALVASLGALKLHYDPPLSNGLDGAYYAQIARHVAQGQGLVTSMSLYHMGLDPLPQPTTTYPLLPWVMGEVGRATGWVSAVQAVPEFFYLVSVVLLFELVRAWLRRSPRVSPAWHVPIATLVTAWFGLNPVYHWASSRPYTESLGFALTFGALFAYTGACDASFGSNRRRALAFAFVGVLAGLAYATRYQLLVLLAGLLASRAMSADRQRWRDLAALGAGASLPIAWVAWRLFSRPHPNAYALLDFASYRQLPSLPRFEYALKFPSVWSFAADKFLGLGEAFDPLSEWSYVRQFGAAAWLVPVALAVLAIDVLRHRQPLRSWTAPEHAALVASVCTGVLALVPVHLIHALHWYTWTFAWRQGLPLCLVIIPALLVLLARLTRWPRALLLGAFALGSVPAAREAIAAPNSEVPLAWLETRRQVGAYLEQTAHGTGTLGIEPQPVAAYSDAPLHWLACWSTPAVTDALVRNLPITRVILAPEDLSCPSLAPLRTRLKLERRFGTRYPMGVFRIQPAPSPSTN